MIGRAGERMGYCTARRATDRESNFRVLTNIVFTAQSGCGIRGS